MWFLIPLTQHSYLYKLMSFHPFAAYRARYFSDINISHSQGSVATPLRCGEICNIFIANFLASVTVNFESRSIFGEVMDKSLVSCFLTHAVCVLNILACRLCADGR